VDGERSVETFASEALARKAAADARGEIDGRTLAGAVALYLAHLTARGRKERTVTTVRYRLHGLLRLAERDRPLRQLTARLAAELLGRRVLEVVADTQVGELAAARGLAAWCTAQGWLPGDPFAGLEASGARARGKAQLRIDEARRFAAHALAEGTPAGLAAAVALLMGARAGEVVDRVCRDVDDGARVLWIERAKTRRGDRQLEVPEVLRPRLAALVAGRAGGEPLWGDVDRHWLGYHVRRLCEAAGVPVVCPHGLRGTYASISAGAVPVEHVARELGQTGPGVTRRHYLAPGAEQAGQQRAALRVLTGGRR
jgi:integrase